MSSPYGTSFYADRDARTRHAALAVLGRVVPMLPRFESAIDVGCGVGSWLAAAAQLGATDIRGVDGPWVDRELLVIPRDRFSSADLGLPLDVDGRYDLAISLEVAEHLPAARAGDFVATLTGLADFVLFAAAIPHQGGVGHVNEQWPAYWAALFEARGWTALDMLRPALWNDASIPFWYRQNTLLYVRRERLGELVRPDAATFGGFPVVHPDLYEARQRKLATVGGALQALKRALRSRLSGR